MSEKQYPSDKQDKFMLRFPDGMRDRIREEAEANGRSMNAEIIHRLEQSFFASSEAGELMRIADSFSKEGALIKGVTDRVRASLSEITQVLDDMEQKADGYSKIASDHETLAVNKAVKSSKAE